MKNLNMYRDHSDSYLKRLYQLFIKIGKPYKSPPGFEYLRDLFSARHLEMMNDQEKRDLNDKDSFDSQIQK